MPKDSSASLWEGNHMNGSLDLYFLALLKYEREVFATRRVVRK